MNMHMTWTEADFEPLSWHDNAVHGIRIVEGSYGAGNLILDVDHIPEWLPGHGGGKALQFRIAPAELTFRETTNVKISIDYAGASAAPTPFSIHQITFETITNVTGAKGRKWRIEIDWPKGDITFESSRFTQRFTGEGMIVDRQSLSSEERTEAKRVKEFAKIAAGSQES